MATPEEKTHEQLNSDCTSSEARALHRVVRAMHDGNCPKCGYLGPSDSFQKHYAPAPRKLAIADLVCPSCGFKVTHEESKAALAAFAPYMEQNVEMFEAWRKRRRMPPVPYIGYGESIVNQGLNPIRKTE